MGTIDIKINKTRIINEFIELIKICSPSKKEKKISQTLKKKLINLGLDVIEDDSDNTTKLGSGNLICQLSGDNSIPPILFTAHMDTVPIDKQVKPIIEGHYIKSDGTTILGADNKVGIAVLLEAIKLLKENNLKHGNIQFVFTAGEESGLIGAKAIDRSLLNAKFGYALDHTGKVGHFVTKGAYHVNVFINIKVPFQRKTSFSAIKIATKVIKNIRLGKVDDDMTIHLINFSGQNERSLLHDYVKIKLNIKSFNKNKILNEIERIKDVIYKLENKFSMTGTVRSNVFCEGFRFNNNDLVVTLAKKAAEKIGLENNELSTIYSSDANIFTSYEIPVVNLAVGYENIHTHLEKYNLNNLELLTKYVISIIKQSAHLKVKEF